MSDLTMYTPGTWVWVMLKSTSIWWPGKIIDLSSVSKKFIESHIKRTKKSVKIAVKFETDNYIQLIMDWKKVCHYSCDRKLEFLKIGFSRYLKQKNNGRKINGVIDMYDFVKDVIQIEQSLSGDINIFDQFLKEKEIEKKKDEIRKNTIKKLFITVKERKKRDRERYLKQLMNEKSKENIHKNKNKDLENEKTISKKKSTVSKVAVSSDNNYSLQSLPSTSGTQNRSKISLKRVSTDRNSDTNKLNKTTQIVKSLKKSLTSVNQSSVTSQHCLKQLMNEKSKKNIHKNKNKDLENEKTISKKKSTVSKVAVSSDNNYSLRSLPSTSGTQNRSKISLKRVSTDRNSDTNKLNKTPQIVKSLKKSLTSVNQSSVTSQHCLKQLMNEKSKENIHKNKNKDLENEKTISKKTSTVSKVAVSSDNNYSLQSLPSTSGTQNCSKISLKRVSTDRNSDTNKLNKTTQIVKSLKKSLTSVNQSSVTSQQDVDNSFLKPKLKINMVDCVNEIPAEFSLNSAVSLIPISPPLTTNNLPSEVSHITSVSQEIIDLTGPDENKYSPCEMCSNIFPSVEKLYEHISIIHKPIAESYKCNLCSRTFEHENILNYHKRSFHRVEMNPNTSLAIPLLNINLPDSVARLQTMGVTSILPVTQLDD